MAARADDSSRWGLSSWLLVWPPSPCICRAWRRARRRAALVFEWVSMHAVLLLRHYAFVLLRVALGLAASILGQPVHVVEAALRKIAMRIWARVLRVLRFFRHVAHSVLQRASGLLAWLGEATGLGVSALRAGVMCAILCVWRNKILRNTLRSCVVQLVFLHTALLLFLFVYSYAVPTLVHAQPLYFDFEEAKPTAVAVFKPDRLERWRYSGESLSIEHDQILYPGQRYDVAMEVELPESKPNLGMGMIMARMDFYDTRNKLIASSSRPFMMRHKSALFRVFWTVAHSVPMLVGFGEEKQWKKLWMMNDFVDRMDAPLAYASVTLSKPEVEVYSARVLVSAHLRGFRYYLHYWFYTSLFVFTFAIAGLQSVCYLLFVVLRALSRRSNRRQTASAYRRRDSFPPAADTQLRTATGSSPRAVTESISLAEAESAARLAAGREPLEQVGGFVVEEEEEAGRRRPPEGVEVRTYGRKPRGVAGELHGKREGGVPGDMVKEERVLEGDDAGESALAEPPGAGVFGLKFSSEEESERGDELATEAGEAESEMISEGSVMLEDMPADGSRSSDFRLPDQSGLRARYVAARKLAGEEGSVRDTDESDEDTSSEFAAK